MIWSLVHIVNVMDIENPMNDEMHQIKAMNFKNVFVCLLVTRLRLVEGGEFERNRFAFHNVRGLS